MKVKMHQFVCWDALVVLGVFGGFFFFFFFFFWGGGGGVGVVMMVFAYFNVHILVTIEEYSCLFVCLESSIQLKDKSTLLFFLSQCVILSFLQEHLFKVNGGENYSHFQSAVKLQPELFEEIVFILSVETCKSLPINRSAEYR